MGFLLKLTWGGNLSPSSAAGPHQYHYIPVGLDSYLMVDLISISFVKSLGLSPCTRPKHQHVEPALEGVGQIQPKTYGFYHLRLHITDHWNQSLEFICPFLAVNHNTQDSQVLLGRPTLKDFKINICNGIDSWEFKCKPKVTVVSLTNLLKKSLILHAFLQFIQSLDPVKTTI